jgi:hypothetical protein
MRCDRVHQRRRETVVRLGSELTQSAAHGVLIRRVGATLDDRGDERSEARRRPARFGRQFSVNEIEAVERMFGVLDPAVHMYAAALAGVTLNSGVGIDDHELARVFRHRQLVARHHRHYREERTRRLPALRAAASMIVGGLRIDRDFDRILRAFADECAAGKIFRTRLDAMPSSTDG